MDFLEEVELPLLSLGLLANPASVALATATALTSLYIYFACPHLLVQMYFRIAVRWSGMRLRTVSDDKGFTFTFGERGHWVQGRPSVILLHGFTADHFMWAPIVQSFSADVHVLALDLPGHGFTSDPASDDNISFTGQLTRIRQFLRLSGMDQHAVHLGGVSMGGALAGLFAAQHPDMVSSVSMCCPSMKTPEEGEIFVRHRRSVEENGGRMTLDTCPLLPQTAAALQDMMRVVSYSNPYAPRQILQGAVDLRKARNLFYLDLVHELVSESGRSHLEEHLHLITCPVQVLWGNDDQVVHVSGVETLRAKLPDLRRVDVIPQCGHAVNLDQPKMVAAAIMEFYAQLWSPAQS